MRSLLFQVSPTVKLEDIVSEKANTMRNYAESQSILWSALKLYASVRDADADFKKFNKELTPAHAPISECRDYRLRWIL